MQLIEMFYDESWKTVHFGVKRSQVKITRNKKKQCRCGFSILVSAGLYCSSLALLYLALLRKCANDL